MSSVFTSLSIRWLDLLFWTKSRNCFHINLVLFFPEKSSNLKSIVLKGLKSRTVLPPDSSKIWPTLKLLRTSRNRLFADTL